MTVIPMTDRGPSHELVDWVRSEERRSQIELALPAGVSIDRFERATATAMIANPDLAKLDRTSLYLSILRAAQLGLVPDGRQCAIVPFGKKAELIVMIGGVRDTLAEYGWMLKTGVVYENDEFAMDEANGTVKHPVRAGTDRGEIVAFYAVASHRDGHQRMATLMSVAQVNEVRDKTGVANNPAWKKWYPQMGEKTVGHRLADDVPLAPQDRRRVEWILNATDLGPAGSARALYGPDAEASFSELPSGHHAYVDRPDIEVPPADAPADDVADPAAPVDDPSGSSDSQAMPREEATPEPVAAAAPLPEPDEEAVMLAAEAAEFVPPSGQYSDGGSSGPLNLAGILDLGDDGRAYLTMCLARLDAGAWRSATEAFARVQMPDAYAVMLADRSKAA